MRVIFLNRYFHPDHSATSQMLSDLAFALGGRGHRVAVITSRQRYDAPDERLAPRETVGEVEIRRVWTSRFGRRNLIGRAADYLTFYAAAAFALWRLAREGDVIVAKTDPPMLSVIAAPLARMRGARLVNWLQDIYPEVAERLHPGGRLSRLAFRLLRGLRDRSLRRAAMNVALGERMAETLAGLGLGEETIRVIPNWADGALIAPRAHAMNPLRAAWGLDGKFVAGYSGNLGRAHDYATLLDAIARVEEDRVEEDRNAPARDGENEAGSGRAAPEIVWLFIGGGALHEAFAAEVRRRGFTSVAFQPYQPRERLAESLSAADAHLVSLRPELEGLIVPSKFYGIAAAGRPAIFIGHPGGEIARLISRRACGRCVAEGDGEGLARAVLDLAADPAACRRMGIDARRAFEAEWDKPIAIARWETLLREAAVQPVSARKAR